MSGVKPECRIKPDHDLLVVAVYDVLSDAVAYSDRVIF
jgi:hypothetical protein